MHVSQLYLQAWHSLSHCQLSSYFIPPMNWSCQTWYVYCRVQWVSCCNRTRPSCRQQWCHRVGTVSAAEGIWAEAGTTGDRMEAGNKCIKAPNIFLSMLLLLWQQIWENPDDLSEMPLIDQCLAVLMTTYKVLLNLFLNWLLWLVVVTSIVSSICVTTHNQEETWGLLQVYSQS